MSNIVVTSVKIDEELWKEAKIEAIRRRITAADLLNEGLRRDCNVQEVRERKEGFFCRTFHGRSIYEMFNTALHDTLYHSETVDKPISYGR